MRAKSGWLTEEPCVHQAQDGEGGGGNRQNRGQNLRREGRRGEAVVRRPLPSTADLASARPPAAARWPAAVDASRAATGVAPGARPAGNLTTGVPPKRSANDSYARAAAVLHAASPAAAETETGYAGVSAHGQGRHRVAAAAPQRSPAWRPQQPSRVLLLPGKPAGALHTQPQELPASLRPRLLPPPPPFPPASPIKTSPKVIRSTQTGGQSRGVGPPPASPTPPRDTS